MNIGQSKIRRNRRHGKSYQDLFLDQLTSSYSHEAMVRYRPEVEMLDENLKDINRLHAVVGGQLVTVRGKDLFALAKHHKADDLSPVGAGYSANYAFLFFNM